ncbi:MAG TPA: RsiV family protein [Pyrinomonadaceae bacterium]|jgi:hypothetical protein
MPHAHGAFVTLAALALLCAQGCVGRADVPRAAASTPEPPPPSAAPAQTPAPPPYPAQKRGDEAFEPFISLGGGRRFESREVERKPARKDLKVGADYPVLVGDRSAAAREFNRRARSFVLGEVTPYLEPGRDLEKEKDPFWKDVEEFYNVRHRVVFAAGDVVSVLFYLEGYNWGAGHSYHQPVTFNFDLKSGREIKLAHLFNPRSDYLRRIAGLCGEDLRRQFGTNFPFFTDGLKPTAKNFKSWVITPGGLVFIFEEYQLVAYAQGEPKVLIPFDSLKEIIEPRGALARLAAHE